MCVYVFAYTSIKKKKKGNEKTKASCKKKNSIFFLLFLKAETCKENQKLVLLLTKC